jgi:hypothetical protein
MTASSTTNTGFRNALNIAHPHIDGKKLGFISYDNCGPAASINSSTTELLKWISLMLNKGIFNEDTIFTQRQYNKLTRPHTLLKTTTEEKVGGTHFRTYGLGWFIYDYQGRKVIQHGGGLPGFHSKVVFIPEDSLGYVILANQLSGLVEAVHKKILDAFLSDSDTDWAQLYLDYTNKRKETEKSEVEAKKNQRIKETNPSLPLNQYVGIYEDKMYGKAEIKLKNNQLYVTLLPAPELFTAELNHWHFDTFNFKFKDEFLPEGFLTFYLNGEGKSEFFTIDLKNPDFHFYKLNFEKMNIQPANLK